MRRKMLIAVSTFGCLLFFLFVILIFQPVPPVTTHLRAQVTSAATPVVLETIEPTPSPTIIGHTPPPPEAIATLENGTIIPLIGPETEGTTIHVGAHEEIPITLPVGFQLAGMVVSDFCVWPPDLHNFCLRPFWLITDGEYYVRLEIERMLIMPDRDLLLANPNYLSRFQWLIDIVGQDKIIDVIWLWNEMENASPERWEGKWLTATPSSLPTAIASITPVAEILAHSERENTRKHNLYLPLVKIGE